MQVKKENICFSSKAIDLAENENYIELTNRVCYYNFPNLNNVELPYDDTSLDKAQTLVNMPVVAKYTTNAKGEPTFKGHEVYYDEEGNIYFGTDNIGTHYNVYIQDDMVTTDLKGTVQTLPCLFAKYRIWKRNQNVVDAVHRLYNEGKLYSSWELETLSYQYDNGTKTLTDYVFLGNCLLGYEYAYPAYGEDAKAIQMSQKENQLLVAEAFSKDLLENKSVSNINKQKEDKILNKETKNIDKSEKADKEISQEVNENTDETSKVNDTVKNENKEESKKVESNNESTKEEEKVEKCADEKDSIISSLKEQIKNLNAKIETQNASIAEASVKIQNLSTQVAELVPFKEAADKAEKERIEAETASKREELKSHAVKSGYIKESEFESDKKVKASIDNVSLKDLDAIIAERFIASLDKKEEKTNIETSSVESKKDNNTKLNLSDTNDVKLDPKEIMKAYLGK